MDDIYVVSRDLLVRSLQSSLVKFRATGTFPSLSPVTTPFQNSRQKVQKTGPSVFSISGVAVLQKWKRKTIQVSPFTLLLFLPMYEHALG